MNNSIVVSFLSVFILGVFVMSGCDSAQPKNQNQRRQPVVEGIGIADVPQDPPEQKEPEQKEDDTVTVKAEVGAGAKGQYGPPTGGPMDIITVPIAARFRAQESITFKQIDHAMNLYKAGNDDNGPATHEEFMSKIIQANGLRLPQLPSGQEYLYDPKNGELKIRKPRNTP